MQVDAVVRELVYAGSQTRVVADTGNGSTLVALVLNSPPATSIHRGDEVTLSWDRAAAGILGS